MNPPPEPDPRHQRLGGLLAEYESRRATRPGLGIGCMREAAGELFDELRSAVEIRDLIQQVTGQYDEPPDVLGRYQIVAELGRGAMGVVYKAYDTVAERTVALKILSSAATGQPGALERFEQEAAVAREASHDHIVQVFDAGESEERLYIAMEYLEGPSLADLLVQLERRGETVNDEWLGLLDQHHVPRLAQPAADAEATYARRMAALFAPVARALGALAKEGLVHRDIKPQNLILDGKGRLKLADFGLARVVGHTLTVSTTFLGTPAYASPEQAAGRSHEVDARTDVYGLGATLYTALTLQSPVEGTTHVEQLAAVLRGNRPPVGRYLRGCPPDLARVVARCLEKHPNDRFRTPTRLASALDAVAGGTRAVVPRVPILRRAYRMVRRHPRAASVGLASMLAAGIFVALLLLRDATLEIQSFPAGTVAVDGGEPQPAPWRGPVAAGRHHVRMQHALFKPIERTIELEPGQVYTISRPLEPRPEHYEEAMALLLASLQSDGRLPDTAPPRGRGPPDAAADWRERISLMTPRKDVTRQALAIRIFQLAPTTGLRFELRDAQRNVLHEGALPQTAGEIAVRLPEPVVRALAPGASHTLIVSRIEDGLVAARTSFRVVEEPGIEERLARFGKDVRQSVHVRLVGVTELLAAGLHADAYEALVPLLESEPDNALVHRLALQALERLGLVFGPRYAEVYATYRRLEAR